MQASLAIYCYRSKQPFATPLRDDLAMKKHGINEVLAHNLRQAMDSQGIKQEKLAAMSGVAQTTISLYLNPDRRKPSASGKPPSGKLAEVEALADALGMSYWELMMPVSPAHRELLHQFSALIQQAEKTETAVSGKRRAA